MNLQERLAGLQGRFDTLGTQMDEILARYGEDELMSTEDSESFDALAAEQTQVGGEMKRIQGRIGAQDPEKPQGPRTGHLAASGATITGGRPRFNERTGGFDNAGQFYAAVFRSGAGISHDKRLDTIKAAQQEERTGAEGGFLVPPDFRNTIMEKTFAETELAGMTDELTTGSNSISVPRDEITDWDNTNGVQVRWEGEGKTGSESTHKLDRFNCRVEKILALVPLTDELMDDAPLMESFLNAKVPRKIADKVSGAIVEGDGSGKPLGILNSPHRFEVPSTTPAAQVAVFDDINSMYHRMYGPWRQTAVWLVNPAVEEKLPRISFNPSGSSTSDTPIFIPANSISNTPYSTLYGRPVIPTQQCAAASNPGDIVFWDPRQYCTLRKGAVRQDTSIHVYFDSDKTLLRFVLRIGGKPWYDKVIAAKNGSFDQSSIVTLALRS